MRLLFVACVDSVAATRRFARFAFVHVCRKCQCRFFSVGTCRFGAACDFSHELAAPAVVSSVTPTTTTAQAAGAGATSGLSSTPILISIKPGVPVFAIDVECIATGVQHNCRTVAQIAVVNQANEVVFSQCEWLSAPRGTGVSSFLYYVFYVMCACVGGAFSLRCACC